MQDWFYGYVTHAFPQGPMLNALLSLFLNYLNKEFCIFILHRDPQIILREIFRERVKYRLEFLASNHTWALGVCDSCEMVQSDVFVQVM